MDKSELSSRLRQFRESLKLGQSAFAQSWGVPRTTLINYEKGTVMPAEVLLPLKERFGMNLDWLLSGEGEMFLPGKTPGKFATVANLAEGGEGEMFTGTKNDTVTHLPPSNHLAEIDETPSGAPDELANPEGEPEPSGAIEQPSSELVVSAGTRLQGRRAVEVAIERLAPDIAFVKFYDQSIGAGPGREVEAYLEATDLPVMRKFLAPWRPEQIRALEARGDSMTKIGLFDRDVVLYVPEEKEGDGIFVISIEGRLQVKRIEFDILGEALKIISENDRYAPRTITNKTEIERVKVEGKVIGWIHRHPY